jgi:hypothetical protein
MFIEEVEPARVHKLITIPLDDLKRKKGTALRLPKIGTMSAVRVAESEEITSFQEAAVSADVVTPFKIGLGIKFSQESLDAEEIGILNAQTRQALIAIANYENKEIFYEINGRTPKFVLSGTWSVTPTAQTFAAVATNTQTLQLTNKPVLTVESVVGTDLNTLTEGTAGDNYQVDYFDGIVQINAHSDTEDITVKYFYTDRTQVVDSALNTIGQLTYIDIISARGKVAVGYKKNPDILIVHQDEYDDILKATEFTDASKYGGVPPVVPSGVVGRIAGLDVLPSTEQEPGVSVVLVKSAACWYVAKRDLDIKRLDIPEADSIAFFFYMEFAPKVTTDVTIALIVNSKALAIAL